MPMIDGEFVEPTNEDRAAWAHQALITYAKIVSHHAGDLVALKEGSDLGVAEEFLGDLLCDLRHWADTIEGLDFDQINSGAQRSYQEELEGE